MRRFRARESIIPDTPGWIDTLPAGGEVRIDPTVPTAAELVAAAGEVESAA